MGNPWREQHQKIREAVAVEPSTPDSMGKTFVAGALLGVMIVGLAVYFDALAAGGVRILANFGDPAAQNIMGAAYNKGWGVAQDDAAAIEWFKRAADQGDPDAQFNLGLVYENGRGVDKDIEKAISFYKLAAENGHAGAQNNLGGIYRNGQGARQDYAAAVDWYRKAAMQGNATGQYNLATMYESGLGVGKDVFEAAAWYRKAAAQGMAEASQRYKDGNYELTERLPKAESTFVDAMQAAKEGKSLPPAPKEDPNNPSLVISDDPRDLDVSLSKIRAAANRGSADAAFNLGSTYELGMFVETNIGESVKWYRMAAERGNGTAAFRLGYIYQQGQGIPQNYVQAHKWYSVAVTLLRRSDPRRVLTAAIRSRDALKAKMAPAQIASAEKEAQSFKPQ